MLEGSDTGVAHNCINLPSAVFSNNCTSSPLIDLSKKKDILNLSIIYIGYIGFHRTLYSSCKYFYIKEARINYLAQKHPTTKAWLIIISKNNSKIKELMCKLYHYGKYLSNTNEIREIKAYYDEMHGVIL